MLSALRERRNREDEGFTLIELMVVVLIIAILLAIAIPTFLGAQDRARDRAAQSNLRNGITAAKTIATDDDGQFNNATVTNLNATEGSITFVSGASPTTGQVRVFQSTPSTDYVVLQAVSASGKWFCMAATKAGKVTYGTGDEAGTNELSATECAAAKF